MGRGGPGDRKTELRNEGPLIKGTGRKKSGGQKNGKI